MAKTTWGDIQIAAIQKMFLNNKPITTDDLEELQTLNDPYVALGGNGTVKIAIKKVKELPLK